MGSVNTVLFFCGSEASPQRKKNSIGRTHPSLLRAAHRPRSKEKTVFVEPTPDHLGYLQKEISIRKWGCIYKKAMYVSRHKNKFIKSWQMPPGKRAPVIDFQNEIVEMYVRREGVEDEIESKRGRHFIRWFFDKRLGANQTTSVLAKLRQNINSSFYIRYNYAYVLVNNETGLRMVFYNQQKGSPCTWS